MKKITGIKGTEELVAYLRENLGKEQLGTLLQALDTIAPELSDSRKKQVACLVRFGEAFVD